MGGLCCIPKNENTDVPKSLNESNLLESTVIPSSLNDSCALFESSRASITGKGYTKDYFRHTTKEVCVEDFRILRVIGRGSFGKVYLV